MAKVQLTERTTWRFYELKAGMVMRKKEALSIIYPKTPG
ncbi:MAG: hypothetical protein OJF51_001904 [Nitrospira sp.]|nr:MAG: hypothetical protein OJF51_001904 [Nitrospira sp.]